MRKVRDLTERYKKISPYGRFFYVIWLITMTLGYCERFGVSEDVLRCDPAVPSKHVIPYISSDTFQVTNEKSMIT